MGSRKLTLRDRSDGWIWAVVCQRGRRQTCGLYEAVGNGRKASFPAEIMLELTCRRKRE